MEQYADDGKLVLQQVTTVFLLTLEQSCPTQMAY